MNEVSRRHFLGLTAGMAATTFLPAIARASTSLLTLRAETRTLDVGGRATTVMGLTNGNGSQGLTLDPGQRFRVDLTNDLTEKTIIHWHGQIPPNDQDGAPNTNPLLNPGETRPYDFVPRAGTYWMHSHVPLQEFSMLSAPLIVRRPEDVKADRQEVVMFLHDFAFATPEEIINRVKTGDANAPDGHDAMMMPQDKGMVGHDMNHSMDRMQAMGNVAASPMPHDGGMKMDLNDYEFDAYLCNDRTLDDPEVVQVEAGGRVHLRIINGSTMTAYWIDTGDVPATLIAVDGDLIQPVRGTRFPVSEAQRLELVIDMPRDGAALPVLALREGSRRRTGLILAPTGARVAKFQSLAQSEAPAIEAHFAFEAGLRALEPLPKRSVTRRDKAVLAGTMQPYVWTINGEVWTDHTPIPATHGERVELTFHNMSMMAHPMHLHGHVFQVVEVGGKRISGAIRDTVLVPQMSNVTIALDAGQAARWLLHCHQAAHLTNGMMTEFVVSSSV